VALVNAKNGLVVASLMFTAGGALVEALNAYRAKAQARGISQEMSADLDVLKQQFERAQAEMQEKLDAAHRAQAEQQSIMQDQIKEMGDDLSAANRTRVRWSLASFCLGLIPFTLKLLGWI
jgi:DNA anti-recombination protein RmuC